MPHIPLQWSRNADSSAPPAQIRTGAANASMLRTTFDAMIAGVEIIAEGSGIRELARISKVYGPGRRKKKKGFKDVRLSNGSIVYAEIHWYEAHGIEKREYKIKHVIAK